MLEVIDLDCVRGSRQLFSKISMTLTPGTLLQVQGANGSGKTSLLRIICGLLTPESGEVRWQGANIRSLGEEYAQSFTYVGHRNGIKEELTSLENLRIAGGLSDIRITPEQAREALKEVGLGGRENLPVRFLSEGQRRRSALARLLVGAKTLWVLDEVLASLDSAAMDLVHSVLEKHLGRGGIAIVATHQDFKVPAGLFQRLELSNAVSGGASPSVLSS